MSGPWGNQLALFSLESSRFPRQISGKENKLFPLASDIEGIIVQDREPIRLLKTPRSLSLYAVG